MTSSPASIIPSGLLPVPSSAVRPTASAQAVPAKVGADRDALTRVYRACHAALFRFLMVRAGNDRALCEDLMQTLWVRAIESGGGVSEGELEFWLRTVARNLLLTHFRREGAAKRNFPRADARLAAEVAQSVETGGFSALLKRREAMDQLLLAMTDLAAEEQDLLVAHYVRGEEQGRIAERLGLPARGVEAKLYRARKALRERLQDLREEME